ncbi:unnamed protein product [Effrenium voratum]|nr:unnamed protein product [Effrenium voratum]CAJ1438890.1 unnamed protein product [Effrenium voratum]
MASGLGGFLQQSRHSHFATPRRRHRSKGPPDPWDPPTPLKQKQEKHAELATPAKVSEAIPQVPAGQPDRSLLKRRRVVHQVLKAAEAKISPRKKHAIHLHTKPAKKNLVVGLPFNWEALLEDKLLGSKRGPGVASQKKY